MLIDLWQVTKYDRREKKWNTRERKAQAVVDFLVITFVNRQHKIGQSIDEKYKNDER